MPFVALIGLARTPLINSGANIIVEGVGSLSHLGSVPERRRTQDCESRNFRMVSPGGNGWGGARVGEAGKNLRLLQECQMHTWITRITKSEKGINILYCARARV